MAAIAILRKTPRDGDRGGREEVLRTALLVSFGFPPAGGSGVHRPAAMARHLPEFGYQVSVLTGGLEWHEGRLPERDGLKVGEAVTIHRTRVGTANKLTALAKRAGLGRLGAAARVLDPAGLWAMAAMAQIGKVLRRRQVDVLWTTAPPYAVALVGAWAKTRYGIRWVADLRSPWSFGVSIPWVGSAGYVLDRVLHQRVLAAADAVVVIDPNEFRLLASDGRVGRSGKCHYIPNGFDSNDLRSGAGPRRDDCFRVGHVGVFYWNAARDRSKRGWRSKLAAAVSYRSGLVDQSPQSASFVLSALKKLVDERPEVRQKLRLVLVGQLHREDAQMVRGLGLSDCVELAGHVSHEQAVEWMQACYALYLPFWFRRNGGCVPRVPSKTYEYIACGKPILCVTGRGETRNLVEGAGAGIFCAPTGEALAEAIGNLFQSWQRGRLRVMPNWDFINRYTWREAARKTAQVFDAVLSPASVQEETQTGVGGTGAY